MESIYGKVSTINCDILISFPGNNIKVGQAGSQNPLFWAEKWLKKSSKTNENHIWTIVMKRLYIDWSIFQKVYF